MMDKVPTKEDGVSELQEGCVLAFGFLALQR
jgi:hypothetical protein